MRKFYKSKVTNKTPEYELSEEEKNKILLSAYIGKKGYTIIKADASENELNFLRKDLFMKPVQFGIPAYGDTQESEFPTYRENTNKMYIPRFYSIQRYGLPSRCEIDPGINIDVPFVKELRDYQINVVNIFKESVSKPICEGSTELGGGGIIQLPCGRGKCLGKGTPILMYDGIIKNVEDIVLGDKIMGDDSNPRNVLSLARGREMMYKIHINIK